MLIALRVAVFRRAIDWREYFRACRRYHSMHYWPATANRIGDDIFKDACAAGIYGYW